MFSNLRWYELRIIAKKSSLVEYKKGEIICKEGSSPDAFYCLVSGRLQAYVVKASGEKMAVEYVRKGMYFGVISLLPSGQYPLTFEAVNDSVILKFEKEDFSSVLDLVPRLAVELSHSLARRIKSEALHSRASSENNIISVYSSTKGAGSSTYAINLALSLERETSKKVIFVSINSDLPKESAQRSSEAGESTPRWKKEPIELKNIAGNHEKVLRSISRGELKIDLLNVVFNPQDSWLVGQISPFVSLLANDYNYVIVDLPTEMDDVVFTTLTQSDIVHLVGLDHHEDMHLTRQVLERLEKTLPQNFIKEKVRVIISRLDPKPHLPLGEISKIIHHDVYATLPFITHQELNVAIVSESLTVIAPHLKSEYSKTVTRISRRIGGVLVGLVLGGGAALGIAHIGVIRVLEKENIPVDIVIGSSIGAVIGSLWAIGKNAQELENVAREFEKKLSIMKLLDIILPSKSGFIRGTNMTRWLEKHLGDKTFYSTWLPLKIVSYDLVKREELVLDTGRLVDAVRQSIAIPGLITPVIKDDQVIIDGGVVNPLPTNVLTDLGIKRIIAVNVLQSPYDVSKGYEISQAQLLKEESIPFLRSPYRYLAVRLNRLLTRLFLPNIFDIIVCSLQATEYVIAEQSAQQADVVIHPDLSGVSWFELYRVDHLIKSGEEATQKMLPAIKKLISE
ncbi:MAG: patatin-like phospholipase family protein [Candidatus Omnitrophota bacterium]